MENTLKLVPVSLDVDYAKKWNERILGDFLHLYKNGVKISDTLYRTGMFGGKVKEPYFLMLKYVEAFYNDSIVKDKDKKRHLEGQWCIIDKNGVEKVNFEVFSSPYIIGGQVYGLNGNYYNIETKELYCSSHKVMVTDNYIFLHNEYDKDKTKRGVLQVKKSDGTFKLIN